MKIWKKLLDLLYPPKCPICHDIVQPGRRIICDSCAERLPFVKGPVCTQCGKPMEEDEELCYDCQNQEHEYEQGIGIFVYNDIMRKSMHFFKYQGRREYGEFYARAAWKQGRKMLEIWNPEAIVPIPVHKARLRERGYNQAEVIARKLSELTGIPVESDYIIRKENTKAQKDLPPKERRQNLECAFVLGRVKVHHTRILLLDDIYTTGSTMDAVSKVLKQGGVKEIYALSICIGKGFMVQ